VTFSVGAGIALVALAYFLLFEPKVDAAPVASTSAPR